MPRFFPGVLSLALALVGGVTTPAPAQPTLTLRDAMDRAGTDTPASRALNAATAEAAHRIREARAGYLPTVDFTESVERGNQPVFVFGSLLGQRRFAESNFAIPALNEPEPLTNIRTFLRVQQSLFDGGATRHAVRGAQLQRDVALATRAASTQDLAFGAARAFVRVLQLEAAQRASDGAVTTAESDLSRAVARRDVGLATAADVLTVEVHLADVRQRQITSRAELEVARHELAEAIGAPVDAAMALVRPSIPTASEPLETLISAALASRAELRAAETGTRLAETARRAAQAANLPRVSIQGGVELNGARMADSRSSWIVGAQLQWNLFRGFGDAAAIAAARERERRASAERERTERRIVVEVRSAVARLEGAQARRLAGEAALAQARESHRILRDRYETGVATITDLLRAAEAVLDAESLATAAQMDVILQTIALDRAVGRL